MRLLLTGGCGFIRSAVIRHVIRNTDHTIVNIDKMTYAASEDALEEARHGNRHVLVRADIADHAAMRAAFNTYRPDAVMHLAAETHVGRSIDGPGPPPPICRNSAACWAMASGWASASPMPSSQARTG